jgi:hypothetical protein
MHIENNFLTIVYNLPLEGRAFGLSIQCVWGIKQSLPFFFIIFSLKISLSEKGN